MVHNSAEAGAFRIGSSANTGEAKTILQGHATELRHTNAGLGLYQAGDASPVGPSLYVSPITEVARLGNAASTTAGPGDASIIGPSSSAAPRNLDLTKSVSDLARAGTFTDMTSVALPFERAKAEFGKAPEIKVQFSDVTANPNDPNRVQPDFVVKQDGSIVMLNNPERTGQKSIVVEVERAEGQLMPNQSQQKAVDDLYTYLDGRIKAANPEAQQTGVKIDDPQDLVSNATEKRNGARNDRPFRTELPPESEPQQQRFNRFRGGGSGSMSREEADSYFPERSVPRQANENDNIAALKDVVAGYSSRGVERPYEHVSSRGSRGWGIGRYGMTYDMISSWLDNLDEAALEKLEAEGKVPKGTAARMKRMKESIAASRQTGNDSDLDPFLQKLKAGDPNNPVTAQDINNNFGKEVQELAASYNVGRFAEQMGRENQSVSPGELSLAMMLGRAPTQEDLANPEYKRFVESADQAYQVAITRYGTQPGENVPFADAGNMTQAMRDAVGKQLWRGYDGVTQYGNLGCAITVSRIMKAGGIDIGDQLAVRGVEAKLRGMGIQRVSLESAIRSGQTYVVATGGHIGIGNGSTVVHNSSSRRHAISQNIHESSLRRGWAYILPTQNA